MRPYLLIGLAVLLALVGAGSLAGQARLPYLMTGDVLLVHGSQQPPPTLKGKMFAIVKTDNKCHRVDVDFDTLTFQSMPTDCPRK